MHTKSNCAYPLDPYMVAGLQRFEFQGSFESLKEKDWNLGIWVLSRKTLIAIVRKDKWEIIELWFIYESPLTSSLIGSVTRQYFGLSTDPIDPIFKFEDELWAKSLGFRPAHSNFSHGSCVRLLYMSLWIFIILIVFELKTFSNWITSLTSQLTSQTSYTVVHLT